MFVMLLNTAVMESHIHDIFLTACSEIDRSAFFVSDHDDARDIITTKFNNLGIALDEGSLIFKRVPPSGETYMINVRIKRTVVPRKSNIGTLRKSTDTLVLREDLSGVVAGSLYPYRVVFSLPEDIRPRLLCYAKDLSHAITNVNEVRVNEFGAKVYFEENPHYLKIAHTIMEPWVYEAFKRRK